MIWQMEASCSDRHELTTDSAEMETEFWFQFALGAVGVDDRS